MKPELVAHDVDTADGKCVAVNCDCSVPNRASRSIEQLVDIVLRDFLFGIELRAVQEV